MTPQELLDRESIRHLMACYNMAGDRLRVADFLAVFTPDGILETDGAHGAEPFRCEGVEEIAQWLQRWRARKDDAVAPTHRATFMRHHLATSHIEFSDERHARGRTYWTAYSDIGPDHCGCYIDEFRREGDQWLIAHRRVRLDWRSPDSLFTTAVARSR